MAFEAGARQLLTRDAASHFMSTLHAGCDPMDLITLRDIDLGFGGDPLLEKLSLRVVGGERVCLLGRNGSGKTSLLRVLMGDLQADGGEIIRQPTIRIAGLPQSVPPGISGSTHSVVSAGLGELGALIEEHLRLSNSAGEGDNLEALEAVHQRIDAAGAWDVEQRIERTLTHLALDGQAPFEDLSGGLQRRVLLARALVSEPQLLLLDEPTNHLDVEAIEWLEGLIASWRGGVLFTTHDRRLLERIATRIIELENGRATSWPGDYANYLRRREERQAAESKERERFEKKLAKEEAWIRQGIKARRTRNEGRVRKLMEMRDVRARRRKSVGRATFTTQSAQASGKRVFEARGVSFGFDDHRTHRRPGHVHRPGRSDRHHRPQRLGKNQLTALAGGRAETGKRRDSHRGRRSHRLLRSAPGAPGRNGQRRRQRFRWRRARGRGRWHAARHQLPAGFSLHP